VSAATPSAAAVPRHDEEGASLGRDRRQRLQQASQVLVRPLGGERQQQPALAELEAPPRRRRRRGRHLGRRGDPLGNDVDDAGGGAGQSQNVLPRANGGDDHAMRAANREQHQPPHRRRDMAKVGLGMDPVDQVVDGDDPPEAAAAGGRVGEAVHQVDPGAGGEAGQQLLLAAHPLDPAACPDRHGHRRDQLPPGPVAGFSRLAVDEGGQAQVGPLGAQGGNQLARVGLHSPGLARHQVDEIEADVHCGSHLFSAERPT
jgi:hypothetical protein